MKKYIIKAGTTKIFPDAIPHAINIKLSPRYIGCLTSLYIKPVFIVDSIGVTLKLRPRQASETSEITTPTTYIIVGQISNGTASFTNLTIIILQIIIPSQNGLCIGDATDFDLVLNTSVNPIKRLQTTAPNLTIEMNVSSNGMETIPTMERFRNVNPNERLVTRSAFINIPRNSNQFSQTFPTNFCVC